ncbi:IpaD/SipD/SspD family type III secretion system needle tip protein [Iodobacter ciconiae]|uniref:Translocator protein BipD n=1 Tax=Iodobacter ciconiae TaxID=2496266 RepID=A0A3S8ZR11_9NEIS|nr:IpaD/SipD/SspD family type III secretion system needle tip protein [Iodobacter ciconiae]AZN35904.1 IpaD/SipD/SspD family type III secretion system needle tip protein [Iodobacter ciconiae]
MSNQITTLSGSVPPYLAPSSQSVAPPVIATVDSAPVEAKPVPPSQLQMVNQQLQILMQQSQSVHQQQQIMARDVLQGKSLTERASRQLEDTRAERQLSLHALRSSRLGDVLLPANHPLVLALQAYDAKRPIPSGAFDSDPDSNWGFTDSIADGIDDIENGYLDIYGNATDRHIALYEEFSKILAELESMIDGSENGQSVNVSMAKLSDKLKALREQFFPGGVPGKNSVLFPIQKGSGEMEGTSQENAEKWVKEMGLNPSCVRQVGNTGKYIVTIDIAPLDFIIKSLIVQDKQPVKMTSTDFQVWKAGFDSMDEKMKNTLQTLTQKYSNAQSTFDNLVKLLSSTISSLLETNKSFLIS